MTVALSSVRKTTAISLALVLSAFGPPAGAQGAPSTGATQPAPAVDQKAVAKAHFDTAAGYLELERYAQAADELEKSVAAHPSASALFNLGNAYQALHRYVDALSTFTRLEGSFSAELKPELRDALARHLTEVRGLVGHLTVNVTPPEAAIALNGKAYSRAPGEVLIDPGEHLVRATLDGYRPAEATVVVRPGDYKTVQLALERALATLSLAATPAGAEVLVDGKRRGVVPLAGPLTLEPGRHRVEIRHPGYEAGVREFPIAAGDRLEVQLALTPIARDAPPPPRKGLSSGFWIAAGGTAIAAGASITLAILAANRDSELTEKVDEYDALPPNTAQTRFDEQHRELEDLQDERDTLHVASIGVGAVAVVGAGIAVALGWDALFGETDATASGLWLTSNGIGGRF